MPKLDNYPTEWFKGTEKERIPDQTIEQIANCALRKTGNNPEQASKVLRRVLFRQESDVCGESLVYNPYTVEYNKSLIDELVNITPEFALEVAGIVLWQAEMTGGCDLPYLVHLANDLVGEEAIGKMKSLAPGLARSIDSFLKDERWRKFYGETE